MLTDESRRPPAARTPIDSSILEVEPEELFNLDIDLLLKNLRTARRGAAAGPSGMTAEHLKPFLEDTTSFVWRDRSTVRQGHNGGGGVTSRETRSDDSLGQARWRSARDSGWRRVPEGCGTNNCPTIHPMAGGATHPYQYALSTRAGTECVAHVVQALTEWDPNLVNRRSRCVRQHLPGCHFPWSGGHARRRQVDPVHPPVLLFSFQVFVGE